MSPETLFSRARWAHPQSWPGRAQFAEGLSELASRRAYQFWGVGIGLFLFVVFAAPILFTGKVPGNLGDSRFNMYVLEHVTDVLVHRKGQFLSPSFFYPYPDTLLFSDTHIGSVPFYMFYRLVGFDPYRAFTLWDLTGSFLTFAAAYWVLARHEFSPVVAGFGATLFAFGLPSLAQFGHAQLAYRFAVPLAVDAVWRALTRKDALAIVEAAAWFFWQILISIYLGFFLALLIVAYLIVYAIGQPASLPALLAGWRDDALRRWRAPTRAQTFTAGAAGCLALAAVVSLRAYARNSALYGLERSWGEVSAMLPRPASWFIMDKLPYWASIVGNLGDSVEMRHEHNMFIGAGALLLVIAAGYQMIVDRSSLPRHRFVLHSFAAVLVVCLFVTSFGGGTLYRAMYQLPGANSIRAVSRIIVVLSFAVAIVAAFGLSNLLSASSSLRARVLGSVLVGFAVLESVLIPIETFDRKADSRKIAALVGEARSKAGSRSNPILYDAYSTGNRPVQEIDAMLASQRLGWPTIMGYSGFTPDEMLPYDCGFARAHIIDYERWRIDRHSAGRPSDPKSMQDFADRLVTVGRTGCALHMPSRLPDAAAAAVPPPAPSISPLIGLEQGKIETLNGGISCIIQLRNTSPEILRVESTRGPVRVSWRFVTAPGQPAASGEWSNRQALDEDVAPSSSISIPIEMDLPALPGKYWLQVSLVSERQFWFHEHGLKILTFDQPVVVAPAK